LPSSLENLTRDYTDNQNTTKAGTGSVCDIELEFFAALCAFFASFAVKEEVTAKNAKQKRKELQRQTAPVLKSGTNAILPSSGT
jgi:hypothetical protein